MSLMKFERIVSVSSEDPAFPAENLLKSSFTDKKWKCKVPGEKQISVVIQMDRESVINAVDIGNYGSAFVEVFVGRSSNPDDFKVLIVASSLMTLQEAKLGENMSNVRFFKQDSLHKPTAFEKWDRIKLVCSQPYNKFIQYGLSFVVVHSKDAVTSEHSVSNLGKFTIKPKDESDNISIGSLFARKKETSGEELRGAAAIRAASTSGIIGQKKNRNFAPLGISSKNEDDNRSEGKFSKEKNSVTDNSNPSVLRKNGTKKLKKDTPKTPVDVQNGVSKAGGTREPLKKTPVLKNDPLQKKDIPKKRLEKPFNQLMSGVIFTISGFQNPLRSDLRNKAIAMGAKYKPDWDNTCTHLLCAFPNTPKFNQVLGHGKIVTKEWFENCYSRRMRLPWRRFALHRPDKNLPESEEEVYEYIPRPPSPVDNRRRLSPGPESSGEDTEDEIERVRMMQNQKQKGYSKVNSDCEDNKPTNCIDSKKLLKKEDSSKKELLVQKDKTKELKRPPENSIESEPNKMDISEPEDKALGIDCKPGPSHKLLEMDIYEMDTEDELEQTLSEKYDLPPLSDIFDGFQFFIGQYLPAQERKKLYRYIFAHKGIISESINRDIDYIITRSAMELAMAKNVCPNAIGLKPDWVWMCHDDNIFQPTGRFEV